jgi:transposase
LIERGVRLALESERPIAHVAADLGIHSETLRKRVRQAEADSGKRGDLLSSQEREEIKKLRKEVSQLRRANEDTTHCPPRRLSPASEGRAGASSASGVLAGGVGLLASPRRFAPSARPA